MLIKCVGIVVLTVAAGVVSGELLAQGLPPADHVRIINLGATGCLYQEIGVENCPNVDNSSCPSSGVTSCEEHEPGDPFEGYFCFVNDTYYFSAITVRSPSTSHVPKWSDPGHEEGKVAVENYKLICYDERLCLCEEDLGVFSCNAENYLIRSALQHLSADPNLNCFSQIVFW
jgi:hypothetical protein